MLKAKPGGGLAAHHLKQYACEACGGSAVVGGKVVRVRHKGDCPKDRMIRLRWPHLRGGVQHGSSDSRPVRDRSLARNAG